MTNGVTVRTKQREIVVAVVRVVFVLVMDFKDLWERVVAAVFTKWSAQSSYAGLVKQVAALRWIGLSVTFPTNALQPSHSTGMGAESLGTVLPSRRKQPQTLFTRALEQGLHLHDSGALTRAKAVKVVVLGKLSATGRAHSCQHGCIVA